MSPPSSPCYVHIMHQINEDQSQLGVGTTSIVFLFEPSCAAIIIWGPECPRSMTKLSHTIVCAANLTKMILTFAMMKWQTSNALITNQISKAVHILVAVPIAFQTFKITLVSNHCLQL